MSTAPGSTSPPPRVPRRVTTFIPTLLTLLNLCLGWLAIMRVFEGRPTDGAVLVLLAAVLDKVDGFVARATDSTSDFGREIDSLADMVSFGVAPAMVSVAWGLSPLGRVGAAAAFLFTACGALRLARFNVLGPATDKRWFVGLPIPMAACFPMSIVISHGLLADAWNGRVTGPWPWTVAVLLVGTGLLMVSRLRYNAFKDMNVSARWRHVVTLGMVAVLAAIVAAPGVTLPLLAGGYVLHGPVLRLARIGQPSGKAAPVEPAE